MRIPRHRLYILATAVLTITAFGVGYGWLVRRGIGIPCIFYTLTGWKCPGCGISRALASLLRLRFDLFIAYNLMAPLIVTYLLFLGSSVAVNYLKSGHPIYRSPSKWMDLSVLVLFLLWGVVRNIVGL